MKYKKNLHLEGYKVFSYATHVATMKPSEGIIVVHGYWSVTTSKHINHVAAEWGLKKVEGPREEAPVAEDKGLRCVAAVAAMGNLLCNTEKEKNDWKLRMLKAGLENRGLMIPADWGSLSEDEKQRRLDEAISVLRGKDL